MLHRSVGRSIRPSACCHADELASFCVNEANRVHFPNADMYTCIVFAIVDAFSV